ncbi:hypothetical protein [Ruegeria sp. HKCCA4707]|uniref:hypothetical protein n=1 Tax=Ruegeria sp. HKCCA4707 TaxID=2682984 RepID=UPI001487CAF0|nr:hypothetical protein [Ruegeria sp. HKCCA4707]
MRTKKTVTEWMKHFRTVPLPLDIIAAFMTPGTDCNQLVYDFVDGVVGAGKCEGGICATPDAMGLIFDRLLVTAAIINGTAFPSGVLNDTKHWHWNDEEGEGVWSDA